MRIVQALLLTVFLIGCGAMEKRKEAFRQDMDAWIGRSADDLVLAKGPPTSASSGIGCA